MLQTVTPKMAQEFLDGRCSNSRVLPPSRARKIASHFQIEKAQVGPGIILDKQEQLIHGQHLCKVITLLEEEVKAPVKRIEDSTN